MKDFIVLKLIDFFSFFYRVMGVNYPVMRKILQIKLLMDRRKVPAILVNNKNDNRENTFNTALLTYGIIGIFFMILIFLPVPLFFKMNLIIAMIIFMVAMTMVSDCSTALLDTKDKSVLLSKPIDAKTVNAAKITHIIINLLTITFIMAGPLLIVGALVQGPLFAVILFFELLLVSGFILFFTTFLYFFILLFFDGDKLKDIINYCQIILSLAITIVYQFVGRIFNFMDLNTGFVFKWWLYLLPSAWFAAPFSLLLENRLQSHLIYLSLMGLLIPILLLIIYFKVAVTYFEKSLHKLDQVAARKRKTAENRAVKSKKLLNYIIPNSYENVFCRFSQNMISSERNLKLRLFPNLGLAAFLPIIMLVNPLIGKDSQHEVLSDIAQGPFYLVIYITVLILSTSILTINSSEKYQGAWLYKALPVESPGVILRGALLGFVLKYLIPVYLFVCLLFAIPYGIRLLPHAILIFLNMLLLIILLFRLSPKKLPFSKDFQNAQNIKFEVVLGSFAFCGISAALHYALKDVYLGLYIYMITILFIVVNSWKTSANIAWKDVL